MLIADWREVEGWKEFLVPAPWGRRAGFCAACWEAAFAYIGTVVTDGLISWAAICSSYLQFRKAYLLQGLQDLSSRFDVALSAISGMVWFHLEFVSRYGFLRTRVNKQSHLKDT